MIIDAHSHIYLEEFDGDREQVIIRARDEQIEAMILPNIDVKSVAPMKELAKQYPGYMHMMMGLHPSSVSDNFIQQLEILKQELDEGGYVAVGEIGLDLYWDKTYIAEQKEAFRMQCMWALEKKLPVSIHSRDAHNEVLSVLNSLPEMPSGIFHCFGGSVSEAEEVINMGFYLGIGGVVSFKNSNLKNVLKQFDPKHLVLETDAPYLAPHPLRGRRNEPSYLKYILKSLGDIYGMSVDELGEITTENAKRLFHLL